MARDDGVHDRQAEAAACPPALAPESLRRQTNALRVHAGALVLDDKLHCPGTAAEPHCDHFGVAAVTQRIVEDIAQRFFALMHLLGFRFAPRIRDVGDTKLYIPKGDAAYDALKPMIGGTLNIKYVRAHWDEILRLVTSIKQGTVTASLMPTKLGSYPRQNGLAVALRELGRI